MTIKIKKYLQKTQIKIRTDQDQVRFAVIADTHIPDRVNALHPALIPALQANKIDVILHCGDLTSPKVFAELEKIAPVLAVMGNRDAYFHRKDYPFRMEIEIFNNTIGLYHGFKSFRHYIADKIYYFFHGYHFEVYRKTGNSLFPSADVLCFGHTHYAEIRRYRKQLIMNPGTAGPLSMTGCSSWGLLEINRDGKKSAYLQPLSGYRYHCHHWVADPEQG